MKDLKITGGKVIVSDMPCDTGVFIETELSLGLVGLAKIFINASVSREEAEANATLYADAHNTYQSTGMTASELAEKNKELHETAFSLAEELNRQRSERSELEKQRDELLEALKGCKAYLEAMDKTYTDTYGLTVAAIQSVEQKQS